MHKDHAATHLKNHFSYIGHNADFIRVIEDESYSILLPTVEAMGYCHVITSKDQASPSSYQEILEHVLDKPTVPSVAWLGHSDDSGIKDILKACGLQDAGDLSGMHYACDANVIKPSLPADIEILEVRSDQEYNDWCSVFADVWNRDITLAKRFFMAGHPSNKNTRLHLIVAYKNGLAVGCNILDIQETTAGSYWTCVKSEYCKQNIASGLVGFHQNHAYHLGCKDIYAHCLVSSRGLYQRQGYQKISDMCVFTYRPS